jgi:hypothetical protein
MRLAIPDATTFVARMPPLPGQVLSIRTSTTYHTLPSNI